MPGRKGLTPLECRREVRGEPPFLVPGTLKTPCAAIRKKGLLAGPEVEPLASPPGLECRLLEETVSQMGGPPNAQILGPPCRGGRRGKVVAPRAPQTARPGDMAGTSGTHVCQAWFPEMSGELPPLLIAQAFPGVTVGTGGEGAPGKTRRCCCPGGDLRSRPLRRQEGPDLPGKASSTYSTSTWPPLVRKGAVTAPEDCPSRPPARMGRCLLQSLAQGAPGKEQLLGKRKL